MSVPLTLMEDIISFSKTDKWETEIKGILLVAKKFLFF